MERPVHVLYVAVGMVGTGVTVADINPYLSFVCGLLTVIIIAPKAWRTLSGKKSLSTPPFSK